VSSSHQGRASSHRPSLQGSDTFGGATANAERLLSGEGLTKVYRMGEVEVHALRGIDLKLRARELVVLLGASGSGKSTLLNIFGGLDTPSAGRVTYGATDLASADERTST